ncbi:MAG: NADH-quinone oxidoreductase subunit C [Candidatus Sumerlaeaceae bacterium]|nr:NADH-quinone oxidoreductase subunit C [Candidatus Sumerlaeaceae bacterium]
MNAREIYELLEEKFPADVLSLDDQAKTPFIKVRRERILPIMRFLRDDPALQFDFLQLITGVDYPDHLESVYHLYSYPLRHAIAIKADLPREAPEIDSVEAIWRAADWHERETFDLMGIIYKGHPDLRRILCPEDWVGHPLRKDYVQPEEYHGISNVRRIGDDWYPKPDEDAKAIIQFKPPKPAKPSAS